MSKDNHHIYRQPNSDLWWITYNTKGDRVRKSLCTPDVNEARRLRDEILAARDEEQSTRRQFGHICLDWLKNLKERYAI